MPDRYQRLVIPSTRGGRNGVDPPMSLKPEECVDAVNVEWWQSTLGRKRRGIIAAGGGVPSGAIVFTGFGDASEMRFFSPVGVQYSQPASNPNPGSGTDGICVLPTSHRICILGGNSPNFGSTGIGIFNPDGTVFGEGAGGANNPSHCCVTDSSDRFYGLRSGHLTRLDSTGTQTATFDLSGLSLPGGLNANGVAVNWAGTVGYVTARGVTEFIEKYDVYAWDLSGNTSLGLFASEYANHYWVKNTNGLLGLSSGDLLVGWQANTAKGDTLGKVVRYNAAGVAQATYVLDTGVFQPLAFAEATDGLSFFVLYYSTAATWSGVTVKQVRLSDATVLNTFTPEDGTFEFDSAIAVLREDMGGTGVTGKISSLARHVPGTDETAAEQWLADDTPALKRRAGGVTFASPTVKDAVLGNGWDVDWATLGGKLFTAYFSGAGFTTPAAPSIVDTGVGSYMAIARSYRVRWVTRTGGTTTRRSDVGASASFTPSGTGLAARIARPTAAGQGETHWEIEVSYDGSFWGVLYGEGGLFPAIVITTTTADDSSVNAPGGSTTVVLTASGTWTRPAGVTTAQYVIVGGGGGGGGQGSFQAGGGGGGQVTTGTFTGLASASYVYTIGAGGAAGTTNNNGSAGTSTTFNGVTAAGGGGGGQSSDAAAGAGSGGGGSANFSTAHLGGTGAAGNAGANGQTNSVDLAAAGGGGGAGGAGGSGNLALGTGGNGGAGVASGIADVTGVFGSGGSGQGNKEDGIDAPGGYGHGGRWYIAGTQGVVILKYSTGLSLNNAGPSIDSVTNRLHVWDGSTVRRAGLPPPAAPTAADTGSGSYTATARYYRVRWTQQVGGITKLRSEPSASVAFTPSGSGLAARVTRPTLAGEVETHWELEGSTDNVTFYVLWGDNGVDGAAVPIATITADDATAPASYSTSTNLSALTGTYTNQTAYRFIAADQGRLIGFGNWVTTARQNDLVVSAVVGSLDVGDEERVDTTQTYRYTLDENDSGGPTGLKGPVFGNFYAFKSHQVWELAPTGVPSNPYRRTPISKTVGCVQRGASCLGEDANGNGALYFFSRRGMYRYGVGGLQYIGKGIEDYVLGPTATVNLGSTHVIAWTLYYPAKRQVWVGWATGSSNDPCQMAIFDVAHDAWSRVPTGDLLANIRCAALFANTVGASMSVDLKPYLGSALTAAVLYKGDADGQTDDAGTAFQAYEELRPLEARPGHAMAIGDAILLAPVATGVTITATATADFGLAGPRSGSGLLTATGSETRKSVRLEGSGLSDAQIISYRIGDAAAVSNAWNMDRLVVPIAADEGKSA